jgi:hypothetical protein
VLTHVGIRSWEGPSLHASTTNRGGCPVEGGWHKRVRRLASVWLGSNMQSSLEAHPRVKSELGCHSHRVSRRPRQSSRALVHCHQTPCCCQLCTLWHRTHTSRTAVTCTTASRVGVRSSQNHHQASLNAPLSNCNVYDARLSIHDGAGADVLVLVRGKHCQRWC